MSDNFCSHFSGVVGHAALGWTSTQNFCTRTVLVTTMFTLDSLCRSLHLISKDAVDKRVIGSDFLYAFGLSYSKPEINHERAEHQPIIQHLGPVVVVHGN